MKFSSLAVLLLLTSDVFAKTLYLDCLFEKCVAETQCINYHTMSAHFLIDTKNQKAWRLAVPTARVVSFSMNDEQRYNLVYVTEDGSVEVTTIDTNLRSTHSIHSMKNQHPGSQLRQLYGSCSERLMFAGTAQP